MAEKPDLPDEVTAETLAWLLDVTVQRVNQHERDGTIQKTARGLYPVGAVPKVIRAMRQRGDGPRGWNLARTELAQERAALMKLRRMEAEAELIPTNEV